MTILQSVFGPLAEMFRSPPNPEPPARLHLTRAERLKVYGDPGDGDEPDRAWLKANIVTVRDLPGVPSRWFFMTHRLIEPKLRAALAAAKEAAPDYQIERAASFVFRHQRHDPRLPLSEHALGIAVDIDSHNNGARRFVLTAPPAPFTPAWRKLWPRGLPEAFVVAMEAHGWTWGGRWRKFVDPMHFEYTRR